MKSKLKQIERALLLSDGDSGISYEDAKTLYNASVKLLKQNKRYREEWMSLMDKLDNRELTVRTYHDEINRLHKENQRYRDLLDKVAYANLNFKDTVNMVRDELEGKE